MKTILIIGACGSGKTYAVTTFMKRLKTTKAKLGLIRFEHDTIQNVAVLGVYDGSTFQGSDKLSMAVMKHVEYLRVWQQNRGVTIIAEGDRFTNKTFLEAMKPTIIKLTNNGKAGRITRGSKQSDKHIQAIATRVGRIPADYSVETADEALILLNNLIQNHEQN